MVTAPDKLNGLQVGKSWPLGVLLDEHSQHTCRDEGCTFNSHVFAEGNQVESLKSSQLHSNTWPSSGVVVPAYIKRVITYHCLGT